MSSKEKMSTVKNHVLNFNVDSYINPFVPPSVLKHVPKPISHWFGYREEKQQEPPTLVSMFFAFLGALTGLIAVGAIYHYAPGINQYHPPALIASLGATAVLEYSAIYTPLSQPRHALLGQTLGAIIGVAISKGFQGYANFNSIQWVAGAVACAISIIAMNLTNTLHPPAGASALIACTEPAIIAMGWYYVPVLMVGVLVMLGVALINNNIVRQFPLFWWSSEETGSMYKREKQSDEESGQDENEKQEKDNEEEQSEGDDRSETTLHQQISNMSYDSEVKSIHIIRHHLTVPADLHISEAEMAVLRKLQARLAEEK